MSDSKRLADGSPDHAGVAFHPPVLLAACIAAGLLADWLVPASFLPEPVPRLAGPAVTACAFGLFFWAVATMRRGGGSLPTQDPTDAIVAAGPYRFTRNPIYLAMTGLQVGIGLWVDSLWLFAAAAVFVGLVTWGVIVREERYLERKFGERYASYRHGVRRWL